MMDVSTIDEILDYKTITVKKYSNAEEFFERNRIFEIGEHQYRIEWFINIRYLYCPGNITVPFINMKRINTWPHRSRMNLQFYDQDHNVCCVLIIEND